MSRSDNGNDRRGRSLAWVLIGVVCAAACGARGAQPGPQPPGAPAKRGPATVDRAQRAPDINPKHQAWLDILEEAQLPATPERTRVSWFSGDSRREGEREVAVRVGGWIERRANTRLLTTDSFGRHELNDKGQQIGFDPRRIHPSILQPGVKVSPPQARDYVPEVEGALPLLREVDYRGDLLSRLDEAESRWYEQEYHQQSRHRWYDAPGVVWLLHARWALERGHRDLAPRALALAGSALAASCGGLPCDPSKKIRTALQERMHEAALAALGAGEPLDEALAWARRAVKADPNGEHAERNRTLVAGIEAALKAPPPPDSKGGTMAQRVEALVRLLPHQIGSVNFEPGNACLRSHVQHPARDLAKELAELGRDATGELLEHATDPAVTRVRGYRGQQYAQPVGDIVFAVIAHHAGHNFSASGRYVRQETRETLAMRLKAAKAWWAANKDRPELDVLREDLAKGPVQGRLGLLTRLLAKEGDAGLAELRKLYERANVRTRVQLLQMASEPGYQIGNRGCTHPSRSGRPPASAARMSLFRLALKDSKEEVRVAAAHGLAKVGSRDWIKVLLPAFERQLSSERVDYGSAQLLLRSGDRRAVAMILKAFKTADARLAQSLAEVMMSACRPGDKECRLGPGQKHKLAAAVRERLVAGLQPEAATLLGHNYRRGSLAMALAQLTGADADPGMSYGAPRWMQDKALHKLLQDTAAPGSPVAARPELTPGAPTGGVRQITTAFAEAADKKMLAAAKAFVAPRKNTTLSRADVSKLIDDFIAFSKANRGHVWQLQLDRFPGTGGLGLVVRGAKPSDTDYFYGATHWRIACSNVQCRHSSDSGSDKKRRKALTEALKDLPKDWSNAPKEVQEIALTTWDYG